MTLTRQERVARLADLFSRLSQVRRQLREIDELEKHLRREAEEAGSEKVNTVDRRVAAAKTILWAEQKLTRRAASIVDSVLDPYSSSHPIIAVEKLKGWFLVLSSYEELADPYRVPPIPDQMPGGDDRAGAHPELLQSIGMVDASISRLGAVSAAWQLVEDLKGVHMGGYVAADRRSGIAAELAGVHASLSEIADWMNEIDHRKSELLEACASGQMAPSERDSLLAQCGERERLEAKEAAHLAEKAVRLWGPDDSLRPRQVKELIEWAKYLAVSGGPPPMPPTVSEFLHPDQDEPKIKPPYASALVSVVKVEKLICQLWESYRLTAGPDEKAEPCDGESEEPRLAEGSRGGETASRPEAQEAVIVNYINGQISIGGRPSKRQQYPKWVLDVTAHMIEYRKKTSKRWAEWSDLEKLKSKDDSKKKLKSLLRTYPEVGKLIRCPKVDGKRQQGYREFTGDPNLSSVKR